MESGSAPRDTAWAMSQENVEIVHRLGDAFNRRDIRGLADNSHDDLELVSVMAAVDAEDTSFRGPETWYRYFAVMDQAWDDWQVVDVEVFDAGDDAVAATFRLVGKGKQSGVPVDRAVGVAYQMREGKVWRMRTFLDPRQALEAVGLSE